jgi:DNA-binding GntR family transcriptional regulator
MVSTSNAFKPVTLVSQIAQFLEKDILDGALLSGKQLVETELCERFKNSRSSIREALRILENKGLVTNIPWKGAFVKEVTRRDFENHFPIRAVLHGLGAKLAYNRMNKTDIDAMARYLSQMKESAAKEDSKTFIVFHAEFHAVIDNATENETLIDYLDSLRTKNSWFLFSIQPYFRKNWKQSLKQHEIILREFKRKKMSEDEIEKMIKKHVMDNLNYYRKNWPD